MQNMTVEEAKERHLAEFTPFTFKSNNGTMPFRLHFPKVIVKGKRYPLVLMMHGAGGLGTDNAAHLSTSCLLAENAGPDFFGDIFVLAPQCPRECHWIEHGDSWKGDNFRFSEKPTASMTLALDILDDVIGTLPVNTDHLAICGASMGGYATYDILSRRPGLFRAAIPICGCGDTEKARDIARADLRISHGALDPTVLPGCSRRMAAALKDIGASFVYTEYPDAFHDAWTPTLTSPELYTWLKGHLLNP